MKIAVSSLQREDAAFRARVECDLLAAASIAKLGSGDRDAKKLCYIGLGFNHDSVIVPAMESIERVATALSLRPLSAAEYGIWKTDLGAPMNFTICARVSGPLTPAVVRAALPAVRSRHPHLRARIVADATGRPTLRHDAVGPFALQVVPRGDWVQEIEREINHHFSEQGPLARFTLIEVAPSDAYVLITLHHSIGDGMSGIFLMRDLIQAAAQALAGQVPLLPELAESDSVDALLPSSARGINAWSNHARFFLREVMMTLRRTGKLLRVRRDRELVAHARRIRLIPRQLDAVLSDRLSARARAEKTTVHGALSAAMILGTLADTNRERAGVTFGSPVNLRSQLLPQVGEQVGFYTSVLLYRDLVSAGMPFWELARLVRRSLEADLARGDHLATLDRMPWMLRLIGGNRLSPRALLERIEKSAPSTTCLSNLGRLTVETVHGPLNIGDCHFAGCPSVSDDFIAYATSLNGRIFWNFVWSDPVFTEAHAGRLVNGILDRLKQAVD